MNRPLIKKLDAWVTPRLIAQLGVTLTLLLFSWEYHNAWRDYHQQFIADASERAADVVDTLQDRLLELEGLKRFIQGAGQINKQTFHDFVQPVLKQPGIHSLGWAPVIHAAQRTMVEHAVGNTFHFTQRSSNGTLVTATGHSLYYPLTLLESTTKDVQELGYDLGSDPVRVAAIRLAEKTGKTTVTSRIRLLGEHDTQYGFMICAPVFDAHMNFRGCAVGIFKSGDMLETALQRTLNYSFSTSLIDFDATGTTGEELLHHYQVPPGITNQLPGLDDLIFPQLTHTRVAQFAGRQWRITSVGTRGYHADTVSLAFLLILPVGFIFTRLSYLYLQKQKHTREEVESLVKARTDELSTSNNRLMDEIMGHRRTVEALRTSRNQFQTFFERIGSIILLIDPDTNDIIDANDAAVEFYRSTRAILQTMKYSDINRHAYREGEGEKHQTNIQLHRLADGEFRAVEVHSSLIERQGKPDKSVLFAIIHDITSRQEMEAERDLHQLHLGIAMDLARLAYWEFDQVTESFTFDDRCYAQYATTSELEGGGKLALTEYLKRFVHPDDAPMVAAAFARETDQACRICPQNLEYRILRRDGALRHLALFYQVGDNDTRHHGATQDITELKQIRRRLEEEQRFLRSLLDTIPDMISYKDRSGRYLGCNEPFASRFMGRSKNEIIGKDDGALLSRQDLIDSFSQLERAALTAATVTTTDESLTMSDGQVVLLETIRIPFRDDDGRSLGIISVSRDVTARRELEQALELSRNHMQTILDNLPMQAWLMDREGRLLMVNNQYAEALRRPREEILGCTVFDLWPHNLASAYHAIDEEIMNTGVTRQVEEQYANSPGAPWFESFKAPIIAADGTILGTTGTARDITQRKQTEELIKMQQFKLEALNLHLEELVKEEIDKNRVKDMVIMHQDKLASIGQLAAGIAHEINTPLGFISSNISVFGNYFHQMNQFICAQRELLHATVNEKERSRIDKLEKKLDIVYISEDIPDLIAESLSGVTRVSSIVLDLKGFSRVDAPDYAMTDLSACMESAVTVLANELIPVAVVLKEYGELPLTLCNPAELNHLFLNLLRNAIQALTDDGAITLKSWFDDDFIYASVSDNGHGIPDELKERIFEPFFTTRDVGKGTGLGLSVCHDIITKHNGILLVESSIGAGTTISVKLPRLEEE